MVRAHGARALTQSGLALTEAVFSQVMIQVVGTVFCRHEDLFQQCGGPEITDLLGSGDGVAQHFAYRAFHLHVVIQHLADREVAFRLVLHVGSFGEGLRGGRGMAPRTVIRSAMASNSLWTAL